MVRPLTISKCLFSTLFLVPLFAELDSNEEEFCKKIVASLAVKDRLGAIDTCRMALKIFPTSTELKAYLVRVLSLNGQTEEALKFYKAEFSESDLKDTFNMVEALAWGVLTQDEGKNEVTKISSLVGAYLTHDARTVSLLIDAMHSSNALLRNFGIKFASNYNDRILQKEVLGMLREEKNWFVRMQAVESVGIMRLKEAEPLLKQIVASKASTHQEKGAAIQALIQIYDRVSPQDIDLLIKHKMSGLRCLGIALIDHFEMVDLLPRFAYLLKDPSQSVRIMLLGALGSLPVDEKIYAEIGKDVELLTEDTNYDIAMMASWLCFKFQEGIAKQGLKRCILSQDSKVASHAAAILSAGGSKATSLVVELFDKVEDKLVKANLAVGMIKLNVELDRASTYLSQFLMEQKGKLMWDKGIYPMFSALLPSNVRHVAEMPRYPDLVDQFARLEILNMLSVVGSKDTKGLVREFLRGQIWGVSGSAAVLVLEEWDLKAIEIVRELLNDEDEKIRLQAALALAFYGKEKSVVKVLEQAYAKMDWEFKINILEALGFIGSRESIPFLLNVMEEPFQLLRTISASSVIQCLYH